MKEVGLSNIKEWMNKLYPTGQNQIKNYRQVYSTNEAIRHILFNHLGLTVRYEIRIANMNISKKQDKKTFETVLHNLQEKYKGNGTINLNEDLSHYLLKDYYFKRK
jgi:hypothetical protein